MVCGVLRESGDAFGRPYPLLIMGSGPMAGWEQNWDLAPFACESVWREMEYVATRPLSDFALFETEVRSLKTPSPEWQAFERQRDDHGALGSPALDGVRIRLHCLPEGLPFLSLDGQPQDQFELVGFCHRMLRAEDQAPPNAVFMGGSVGHAYFAPFRRALTKDDFVRLWSVPERKEADAGMPSVTP